MRGECDAVVVGSGPNGLSAAVTLARAGLEVVVYEAQPTIGGGARTLDLGLTDDGVTHDLCSAVHPFALASPFFTEFDLRSRGVEIVVPEVSYAHPLDSQAAAVAWRDLDRTVDELPGTEGKDWERLLRPLVDRHQEIVTLALSDKRSLPPSLLTLRGLTGAAHFARVMAGQGARWWDRQLPGTASAALFAGVGAHSITPMPSFAASGAGALLAAVGHTTGWGVPAEGSQAITNALRDDLLAHGGRILTQRRVETWRELPRARAYLFDTTPSALAAIWAEKMPGRAARALRRFPYGAGATKVDFVLSEPVPWRDERLRLTGTVHLGGTRDRIAHAENEVSRGRHAEDPFVLVSEPGAVVPARNVGGLRPLWTYAHVPAGSHRDLTEKITKKIERYAPGFRDVVVASRAIPATDMEEHNANYIGGDIAAGAAHLYRLIARPTPGLNPYSGAIPGVYLCSASTPPGPAVHGMSGWYAATRALRQRFAIASPPSLAPR